MPFFTLITSSGLLDVNSIDPNNILLFGVKVLFMTAGVLYALFAFLITRQIAIMSKTINTTASPQIKLLGAVHFVLSIVVLIYFIIVL